jgi:hypothetical protein
LSCVGRFDGPEGTVFYWRLPGAVDEDAGRFDAGYASTVPNFVLLRRVIFKLSRNANLNYRDFTQDGLAYDATNNLRVMSVANTILNVGVTKPPQPSNPYVRSVIGQYDIIIDSPGDGNRTWKYFLQYEPEYECYMNSLFERLESSSFPSAVLTLPQMVPTVPPVPAYPVQVEHGSLAVCSSFSHENANYAAAMLNRNFQISRIRPATTVMDATEAGTQRIGNILGRGGSVSNPFNEADLFQALADEFYANKVELFLKTFSNKL